ncbi:hypothetical protein DPMN_106440 [Dreissena polymorpha]|uniref:Uncharacterized protein n=1 Tax=Dreissena polymorpha TaxID=45954 RepID=A0A9D4K554_DREPO|nr:hypothetical protein DPMN_106440 [Dreissena polymorpha]
MVTPADVLNKSPYCQLRKTALLSLPLFLDDLHLPCGEDESNNIAIVHHVPRGASRCLAVKGFLKFYKSFCR